MVYFKVSDGEVTRKFKVNPGEITYEQLKERIAALFPKAIETNSDLHLKYRDSDGDLITISTNEEFQEALAELPEEHIWKLHIHRPSPYSPRQVPRTTIPSDFFFQPTRLPFGGGFGGGFGGAFSDPWFGSRFGCGLCGKRPWTSNPWSSLEKEFDKMLEQHTETLNSLHNTAGGAAERPEQEGAALQTQGDGTIAESSDGKMKIKNFGSWEPKEFDGPFGKGRVIGPVGYYISWSSGHEEKQEEEKVEASAQETTEPAAAKETTEGMET